MIYTILKIFKKKAIFMNYRDLIVFDFETTSKWADTTQPVQLAAVVIHGRKLEIKPGTEFQSLIRPVFDEKECEELKLDPLTEEAIAIHGKTRAMLETAPTLKSVWSNFVDYVNEHNFKKDAWNAPISCGYNIRNFDNKIVERICCQEPWAYGPKDKRGVGQGLFHPIHSIDIMDLMHALTENNKEVNSLSVDNLIRGYMGYAKGTAHDALSDVLCCAEVYCRTQRLFRDFAGKFKIKDSFK